MRLRVLSEGEPNARVLPAEFLHILNRVAAFLVFDPTARGHLADLNISENLLVFNQRSLALKEWSSIRISQAPLLPPF